MKTVFILVVLLTFALHSAGFAEELATPKNTEITVNVLGAVSKPARVTLPAGASILDALAASGGAAGGSNLKRVKIIHKSLDGKGEAVTINVQQILDGTGSNVALQDGDTINVPLATYGIQY